MNRLESHDELRPSAHMARRVARELVSRTYPDAHAEGVADLACQVGLQLGLPSDTLRSVVVGALVHDIGKLTIDAAVLEKPTRLDEDEWQLIKRHPHEGARLVTGVFSDEVVAVVRWHHERWDGTGYPDALPGAAIPAQARIVAVADAFRAMREDRPYRRPIERSDAAEELQRGAGTQWDPQCVNALLSVISSTP